MAPMFSRSVALVNAILMLHAETPLAVAAIARAAGLSYTPAASAIATLEKRGLVRPKRRAGQDEFEPNRDDPHYPMAYAAALVDLPIAEALTGLRVYAIYAYGSVARPGGGTRDSDLDLLIVVDGRDREESIKRLLPLGTRIGRSIDPFVMTPEQLDEARRRDDAHVRAALGSVRIFGSV